MPSAPFLANRESAFHRLDLLVVLGVLALLALAILPVLSNTTARGERIACMNNLRLITRGFYQVSTENEDLMPWWNPSPGGSVDENRRHLWYYYYFALYAQSESPKILADPGDKRTFLRVAQFWNNNPAGGFINSAYRDNAISYFLGMHATTLYPRSVLTGDRNISVASFGFCSSPIGSTRDLTPQTAAWTSAVHAEPGNLAYMDGSVEQTDTPSLKRAIEWRTGGGDGPFWNSHFAFPE